MRAQIDPAEKVAAAPAWLLDQFEELHMSLTDDQLIHEAIER